MAKKEQLAINPAPVAFKMRNTAKIFHHLFKAKVAMMMKNISWVKNAPNIDKIEHAHYFHTCNSMGMPQEFTTPTGGHFHAVKWSLDENGIPTAKCGPPMKKETRNTSRGSRTFDVPVKFFSDADQEDANGNTIMARGETFDTHTHELFYMGTDELSPESIRTIQQSNAAFVSKTMPKPVPNDEAEITDLDRET